jgi:hypothetical protein
MTYECPIHDLFKNSVPDKATNYQNPPSGLWLCICKSHSPQTYNWLKQGLSTQEAWWLHLRVGTLAHLNANSGNLYCCQEFAKWEWHFWYLQPCENK